MARGRRPSDVVRAEILAAAGTVLREQGMSGFSIEKVAQESGASKVTIYKSWPTKGALAMAGYFAAVEADLRFPDTGDVEADLRTQLHSFRHVLTDDGGSGRAVGGLIAQVQSDAELRAAWLANYSRPRRDLAAERLRSAIDAGELRADLDVESVVDQLWGACYHRLLVPDEPIDAHFVDSLVDNLFRGLRR